jgi:uncharacterized protein
VPFEDIALVDNHAHPWLRQLDEPLSRYFTEAAFAQQSSLFYRHAMRELTAFGVSRDDPSYARRLVEDANIDTVLLDDGYPREGAHSVAECSSLGGFRALRVARLERIAEDLLPSCSSLSELETAVVGALDSSECVALKSIIAYRTGLVIDAPRLDAADGAFQRMRSQGATRLSDKPLLDWLFHLAAEWTAQHARPLHLHTGFGDRDLDLRLANPLHLKPLLDAGVLGRSPLVLLHASYPFHREAAYMSTIYQVLYVDLSEVSPLLVGPALQNVLEDILGAAPITRLLYGSDAWGIPDWLWLAARATRRALADATAWLPPSESRWVAERVLRDNAFELYGL